jgi:DNA repair exonuclease SbcCD ATPase subunit
MSNQDEKVTYAIEAISTQATEELEKLADNVDNASDQFTELADNAAESMDRLSNSVDEGSNSIDSLANSAQQGGRGVSQISRVVSMFSPALGKMVAGVGAAMTAFKGLRTVMVSLQGKMIILVGIIAAVGAAYALLNGDTEEQKRAAEEAAAAEERLAAAMDNLKTSTEALARARSLLRRANGTVAQSTKDLVTEIKILNTQSEKERKKLTEQSNRQKRLKQFTDQLSKAKQTAADASAANTKKLQDEKIALDEKLVSLKKQIAEETKAKPVKVSGDTGIAPARFETKRGAVSDKTVDQFILLTSEAKKLDTAILNSEHSTRKLSVQAEQLANGQILQNKQAKEYNRLLKARDASQKRFNKNQERQRKREQEANKKRKSNASSNANAAKSLQELEKNRLTAINRILSIRNSIEQVNKKIKANAISLGDMARTAEEKLLNLELKRQNLIVKRNTGLAKENALKRVQFLESQLQAKTEARALETKTATLSKDQENVNLQQANLNKLIEQVDILRENKSTTEQITKATKDLEKAQSALAAAEAQQQKNKSTFETAIATQKIANLNAEKLATEQRTQSQLESIIVLDQNLKSLNSEYSKTASVNPYASLNDSLSDIRNQIKTIREDGIIPEVESQLTNLENGLKAFEAKARTEIKATIVVDKIQGALDTLNNALSNLSDPGSMISGISSGLGMAIGGPAGAAIGGSIGSLFKGLTALGEKDPAEIEAEMMAFTQAFIKGLQVLPKLLIKLLPKFVTALSLAILTGIGVLVTEFVRAISDIFTGAFDALKIEDGEGFFDYIGRQITQIFDFWAGWLFGGSGEGMRSGGSARPLSGRNGIRMTRGTGMALLHPNEFVVPQSGMTPQAVSRTLDSLGSGQNGTSININSLVTERSAIDELVTRIEQRYQLFGQSRSSLFVG